MAEVDAVYEAYSGAVSCDLYRVALAVYIDYRDVRVTVKYMEG
jgi:hypothetical protein